MNRPALLLSMRPEWARLIRFGYRDVEMRRQVPRNAMPGDRVFTYESGKVKALTSCATVGECLEMSATGIWSAFGERTGLRSHQAVSDYLQHAIAPGYVVLEGASDVPRINLAGLREIFPGFRPPQSYCYMLPHHVEMLENALLKLGWKGWP